VQISLGAAFPVRVLPRTQTVAGVVWRQVELLTIARASAGWLPASALTLVNPHAATSAGLEALDPRLRAYLDRLGTRAGVSVHDITHGVTYRYDSTRAFVTASSVKVPIMLAFLRQLEAAGRHPTRYEVGLLTAMIEHSDNDAASILNRAVGDRLGLQRFARAFGLTGFRPGSSDDVGWGWGTISTDAMVRLLTLFQQGKVLSSAADSRLARMLMSHIEDEQRFGVGTTAPAGATVLMKDGWVPGPDGRWVANSSGIVISGHERWIIAVYTAHLSSFEEGRAILNHVCAVVAARLDR